MRCANPECHNLIPPGGGTKVYTRFVWNNLNKRYVVCSRACIYPALVAK